MNMIDILPILKSKLISYAKRFELSNQYVSGVAILDFDFTPIYSSFQVTDFRTALNTSFDLLKDPRLVEFIKLDDHYGFFSVKVIKEFIAVISFQLDTIKAIGDEIFEKFITGLEVFFDNKD